MKLPSNWNSIDGKEYGAFKAIEPGGYICRIVKAEEKYSQSNKHMLVIHFDINEGTYKDFYKQRYDANTNINKKWQGIYYQLTEGNSEIYFKGLITAIEKSNNGFTFTGNELELNNKVFGGVFGEKDYEKQDGTIGTITTLKYIASIDRIRSGDFRIPKKDELKTQNKQPESGFYPSPNIDDEDLPF